MIVTYKDGSTENVKEALSNGHIKITDLDKYGIYYCTNAKLVEDIVDLTESKLIPTDDAIENFYHDEFYSYRFASIKSQYIIVYYKDGTEQNVKDALQEGKIRITDLDWYGIGYDKIPTEEMREYLQQLTSCFARRRLTLYELKALVLHYGEDLTWEHFDSYYSRDVGSGLEVLSYPINDDYRLLIGGASADESPIYIYLVSNQDIHNHIEVRSESINVFLDANRKLAAVPEDFSFALTWGCFGISSYDSETGRLVKTTDATNPDDYVTDYELKAWERAYIYELLTALNANSYPDIYDPGNGLSEPSMTLILKVRANGAEKIVTAEDIALDYVSDDEKGQAFLSACKTIEDLLTATKEWKALPEYENLYE